MKTMALVLLLLIVVALAVLLYLASRRPDTYRVQRKTVIAAPPERIFPLIANLRSWGPWSPYLGRDPAMSQTFGGPEEGAGAVYTWDGNRQVGAGRIEVVESVPPSRVGLTLDMTRPFAAHNDVEFLLEPAGAATEVTWAMSGRVPFLAKIVHTLMDMDRMVGRDFETGLASLKRVAEAEVAPVLEPPRPA